MIELLVFFGIIYVLIGLIMTGVAIGNQKQRGELSPLMTLLLFPINVLLWPVLLGVAIGTYSTEQNRSLESKKREFDEFREKVRTDLLKRL